MRDYFLQLTLPDHNLHPNYWDHTNDQYLRQLYAIVRKEKPRLVVELGTYYGYSTNTIGEALKKNFEETEVCGHVATIDLHEDNDYQPPDHLYPYIQVYVGNTHDPSLIPVVLGGYPIDILFIDADHTYESTKKDFQTWSPFVKPGGIVLFHDIRNFPEGCSLYWNQLVEAYPGRTHSVPDSELGILTLPDDWMIESNPSPGGDPNPPKASKRKNLGNL